MRPVPASDPQGVRPRREAGRPSGAPRRRARYVYYFGDGKADGNRTMKDTLGGKGSGLAEMTNAGLPVPPGFTISTQACNLYYSQRRQADAGDRERDRHPRQEAREERQGDARLVDQPAAGLGALGREVLDAGDDGHDPQPRTQRPGGRGAQDADEERPLRLRQLPPLHPDVRLGGARDSQGQLRARVRGGEDGGRRQGGHRPRRGGAAPGGRSLQGRGQGGDEEAVPAGSPRSAADGPQRRLPLVEQPAGQGIPPHLRHPRQHRHRRQRPDDGLRQHRRPLGHRRRLHPQPGHRRQGVLRRVPGQRPGRGRRRRHPHAAADPRARSR